VYVYVYVYVMYVCVYVCMLHVFFSSFNGTEYQQSTSVHNISKNVGATFEILGARRVT